jgi:hypothetical protein
MAFNTPYVTDKSVTYKGDVITTHLSAAIWLIDDFAGKEAVGQIRVKIKETNKEAITNLSGYYIFTNNLVSFNYTIEISSDLYFSEEIKTLNVILNFDTNGPAAGATSTKVKNFSTLQQDDTVEFRNPTGDVEHKAITDIDASNGIISWAGGLKHSFSAKGSCILSLKNPVVAVLLKPLPSYPFPNRATLVRGLLIDSSENPVSGARIKVVSQNKETKSDNKGEFVLYFNGIKGKVQISIEIEYNGKTIPINTNLEEGMKKSLGKIVCA